MGIIISITPRALWALSLAALCAVPAGAEKKMKGDDLSNIIIQGENRLRVNARAPDLDWSPDPYKEIPTFLADNAVLSTHQSPSIGQPPVVLPPESTSRKTASPWLAEILEAPLLTLDVKPKAKASTSTAKSDAQNWVLLVKDSAGKVFYEDKKKSILPPSVSWNGMGKSGPIQVGRDFSYSFSTMDKAGNAQRFGGKAFRVDGFRYRKGGQTITLLAPNRLFEDDSSAQLSPSGQAFLAEVKDTLRRAYGKPVAIVVHEKDAPFADARAKTLRDTLTLVLNWPDDKMTAQGRAYPSGGYSHVEIIAR